MIAWPKWLTPTTSAPRVSIPTGALSLPPGSWQNPAWAPDMSGLSLTRFATYNEGAQRVAVYPFATGTLKWLASGVSQPGACWHRTQGIIFSNDSDDDAEGDAIFAISPGGGNFRKLLGLRGLSCYEPSWSPGGDEFAAECHMKGQEGLGRIIIANVASGHYEYVTKLGLDCRQPNWDPRTNRIVYQRATARRGWDLMVQSPQESPPDKLCSGTDATWYPGGVVYSGEDGLYTATLTGINRPLAARGEYKGAPSISPDGKFVACEASDADPDGGPGTRIEIWPVT